MDSYEREPAAPKVANPGQGRKNELGAKSQSDSYEVWCAQLQELYALRARIVDCLERSRALLARLAQRTSNRGVSRPPSSK